MLAAPDAARRPGKWVGVANRSPKTVRADLCSRRAPPTALWTRSRGASNMADAVASGRVEFSWLGLVVVENQVTDERIQTLGISRCVVCAERFHI